MFEHLGIRGWFIKWNKSGTSRDSENSKGQSWWVRQSPIDESLQNHAVESESYPG